jgi:hypothetical protein
MSAQFWDVRLQAYFGKQAGYLRAQSLGRYVVFIHGDSQNIPHLFLHTAAVTLGATLKARFDDVFYISNYELSHVN